MRFLELYLRSRSVPASVAVVLGSTAAIWWLTRVIDEPPAHRLLALLAVLAVAVAVAPGLAAADRDLERGAGIAWPPRRAAHVVLAAGAVLGILAAAPLADAGPVARDVAGMAGLVALGATVFGASRAWLLPVPWTILVTSLPRPDGPAYRVLLTWMIQPAGTRWATVAAAGLSVAGALAYTAFGARR
jgi:hypothetical protein